MKYWETTAENLKKAGWSLGYVSGMDSEGRTNLDCRRTSRRPKALSLVVDDAQKTSDKARRQSSTLTAGENPVQITLMKVAVLPTRVRTFFVLAVSCVLISSASAYAGRHYGGGGRHTVSHGGSHRGGHGSSHKSGHFRNVKSGNQHGQHKYFAGRVEPCRLMSIVGRRLTSFSGVIEEASEGTTGALTKIGTGTLN